VAKQIESLSINVEKKHRTVHPDWLLLLRCHGSPRVHTLSIIQWEHFKTMKVVFKSRGTSPSSSACPPGLHGPLCQLQCDCMNGASCHPASGRCVCPPGYLGARCHRGRSHRCSLPPSQERVACIYKPNLFIFKNVFPVPDSSQCVIRVPSVMGVPSCVTVKKTLHVIP